MSLDGIVAASTRLSRVDGEAGQLLLAGYPVEEIAPRIGFEEMLFVLWHDRRPHADELATFDAGLRGARALAPATRDLLRAAARRGLPPMDALRMGAATLALEDATAERVVASLPVIAAAYARLLAGQEPVAPDAGLPHAANYLFMLDGAAPAPACARALETYLNVVSDHGLNASTFTARVIASTRSDMVSAVEGALGALKGPLHGGAPGPALASLQELRARGGDLDAATRAWVRETVDRGERVMGFGHRVYKVRDPRADVLGAAAERLLRATGRGGDARLLEDARVFERAVVETLAQRKPGRRLHTNVEFFTALLLHGLGLDASQFTPTFAVGRVAGWTAHVREQLETGRLIRPLAEYVGRVRTIAPAAR